MPDSVNDLWKRRPTSVSIRAGPSSSTANNRSLDLGIDTGPDDRSPSATASCQTRHHRRTERTLTREPLARRCHVGWWVG
ncbi:hypothetical protein ABZT45_47820 [Streptomyces sp. NPDC005356]|uniref:hypothetical protein n=1 Tax=unclassified Streptomyces TaxID=2593676 RepID=UPI0033B94E82